MTIVMAAPFTARTTTSRTRRCSTDRRLSGGRKGNLCGVKGVLSEFRAPLVRHEHARAVSAQLLPVRRTGRRMDADCVFCSSRTARASARVCKGHRLARLLAAADSSRGVAPLGRRPRAHTGFAFGAGPSSAWPCDATGVPDIRFFFGTTRGFSLSSEAAAAESSRCRGFGVRANGDHPIGDSRSQLREVRHH